MIRGRCAREVQAGSNCVYARSTLRLNLLPTLARWVLWPVRAPARQASRGARVEPLTLVQSRVKSKFFYYSHCRFSSPHVQAHPKPPHIYTLVVVHTTVLLHATNAIVSRRCVRHFCHTTGLAAALSELLLWCHLPPRLGQLCPQPRVLTQQRLCLLLEERQVAKHLLQPPRLQRPLEAWKRRVMDDGVTQLRLGAQLAKVERDARR